MVSVRYIATDVDAAVDFDAERPGFNVDMRPGPALRCSRGCCSIGLARAAWDSRYPMAVSRSPGLESYPDRGSTLEREATRCAKLEQASVTTSSPGGSQILLEDPSGNPIELFKPADT